MSAMNKLAPRKLLLVVLGVVTFLALAGCSGGGGKAAPTAVGTAPTAQATPGTGAKLTLPHKTIGHLQIAASDVAAKAGEDALHAAVNAIGWDWVTVDAAGDPTKMAQGMLQLANENVDAIVSLAVEPSIAQEGLQLAKQKNIPVINYAGLTSPSPLFAASVSPSDYTLSSFIDYYMINQLEAQPGGAKLFIVKSELNLAYTSRYHLLQLELASMGPDIQVVGAHEWDMANSDKDVNTAVAQALQANPDLSAVWTISGGMEGPAADAIAAAGKTGQVKLYGFYGVPLNLDLIRKGQLTAVAEKNTDDGPWTVIDMLAQYFATGQPLSTTEQWEVPQQYVVIDKTNVPASGAYQYPFDVKSYFLNKWKNEFSNIP